MPVVHGQGIDSETQCYTHRLKSQGVKKTKVYCSFVLHVHYGKEMFSESQIGTILNSSISWKVS